MKFVRATPSDYADMNHVWSWVYRNQPPDHPLEGPERGEDYFIVRNDAGEPVSACQIFDFLVTRGEAQLRCGGIGAVATPIEHRGSGAASVLMNGALQAMREEGQVLSALYGFRETYYRKFGYEMCGWRWQITAPTARLPKFKKSLPVRQIKPEDYRLLDEAYLPMAHRHSGFVIRSNEDWVDRLGKKPPPIFAVGDPIEAYAWVTIKEFWGMAEVGEIVWRTRRGYQTILSVLRDACHNQTNLRWTEPPESPFVAQYVDQGIECELKRMSMFRVVDVPRAIRLLKPETTGSLCLKVIDEQIPENQGPWAIDWSPEGVSVMLGGEPELTIDIRAFTQAFMGQPSWSELQRHGAFESNSPQAVRAAADLMPPLPVMCSEFF